MALSWLNERNPRRAPSESSIWSEILCTISQRKNKQSSKIDGTVNLSNKPTNEKLFITSFFKIESEAASDRKADSGRLIRDPDTRTNWLSCFTRKRKNFVLPMFIIFRWFMALVLLRAILLSILFSGDHTTPLVVIGWLIVCDANLQSCFRSTLLFINPTKSGESQFRLVRL